MGRAAVVELKGNFIQGHFIVNDQFFNFFNFLVDVIFFDSGAFDFGKQIAQGAVILH